MPYGQQGLSFPVYIILYPNRSEHCMGFVDGGWPPPIVLDVLLLKSFPKLMKHKALFTINSFLPYLLRGFWSLYKTRPFPPHVW